MVSRGPALHDDDGRSAYQPGGRPRRPRPSQTPTARTARSARWWRQKIACHECGKLHARRYGRLCLSCVSRANQVGKYAPLVRRQLSEPFKGGRSSLHESRVRRLQAHRLLLPL
jgi:hypothetical protein